MERTRKEWLRFASRAVAATLCPGPPLPPRVPPRRCRKARGTPYGRLPADVGHVHEPGFALVECGLTRAKNAADIIVKNYVEFMIGVTSRRISASAYAALLSS